MTEPSPAPGSDGQPRARGGQPGNRNAVRHGFYVRYLPLDPELLTQLPPSDDLTDEIAMLRLAIRNIAAQSTVPQPLEVELQLLRSINLAAAAINRVLRTRLYLGSGSVTKTLLAELGQLDVSDAEDGAELDEPYSA
ncbi:MAG: hypothetical protein WC837_14945 [Bellilinea sp.]